MVSKNNSNIPESLENMVNRDILPIDSNEGDGSALTSETSAVIGGLFKQLQNIINPEAPVPESLTDDQGYEP